MLPAACVGPASPYAPSVSTKGFISSSTSSRCDFPSLPLYTRQILGIVHLSRCRGTLGSTAVRNDLDAEQLDRIHDFFGSRSAGVSVAEAKQEVLRARRLLPALELAHAGLGIAQDQTIGRQVVERERRALRNRAELREPPLPVVAVRG